MNPEKLAKLQQQVRIGGKGSARRKKKVVHRSSTTDDKKLQSSLKKLSVSNISGIEEVNMIKDDGSVIHFNNPKVQASLSANTFAVSGHADNKQITEMLPGILNHLGAEGFNQLKRLASSVNAANASSVVDEDDDDVPDLVEDFEAASKNETATETKDDKVSTTLEEVDSTDTKTEPSSTTETEQKSDAPESVKTEAPESVNTDAPESVKSEAPETVKSEEPESVKSDTQESIVKSDTTKAAVITEE